MIQRYRVAHGGYIRDYEGAFVLYTDHLANEEAWRKMYDELIAENVKICETVDKLRIDHPAAKVERCDTCGSTISHYPNGCPLCGAPQCCQSCCKQAEITRLSGLLAEARDMAKP